MRFVREIPENKLVQTTINDLEQHGFTLVWKHDSLEIWAEVADTALHYEQRAA